MTYSKDNIVSFIIIILHLVGVIGTALPVTRELVVSLTPINLLITFSLLIYTHEGSKNYLVYFLLLSTLIGFGVEVMGVSTGWPFGNYAYGNTTSKLSGASSKIFLQQSITMLISFFFNS